MAIQTLMGCSQDWVDHSGLNQSSFDVQQLQYQQQHQQFQNQIYYQNNNNNHQAVFKNSFPSLMAAQAEKERQEIDSYIRLHNERLSFLLQEQRKQQLGLVLRKIESAALPLFKQRDEELLQVKNRAMELEYFLKKLEMENQAWKNIAKENEAMIVSLNNSIEKLRETHQNNINNEAEDEESCCHFIEEKEEKEEVGKTAINGGRECKVCKSRKSCVLFLPCRHLCTCKDCEAFIDSCPICKTVKNASIEVLL